MKAKQQTWRQKFRKQGAIQAFVWAGMIYLIIFNLIPMFGIIMGFKDYNISSGVKGILTSEWVGFKYFKEFVTDYKFGRLVRNTVALSVLKIIFSFPLPIIFALMVNEIRNLGFKKLLQTCSYLPHFISVVVLCGMLTMFLSPSSGIVNILITKLGGTPVNFLQESGMFKWVYVLSGIWQGMGWSSIIYFATLSGVDKALIEAADIDGATRLQKIRYINIPVLLPTILILLILQCGNLLSVGYEKVYLLQNATNLSASEVISTYVYKTGLTQSDFSFATAVGLFNSVINTVILVCANTISKVTARTSLF